MKHWKTKQEMGSGFSHTKKQHKEFEYNSLIKVKPYEQNLMRTLYLCRDIWTQEQRIRLKNHLELLIKHSEEEKSRILKDEKYNANKEVAQQ